MEASTLQNVRIETAAERAPVAWKEVASVLLLVALCDVTIYRGAGYAGLAALVIGAPVLLMTALGRPQNKVVYLVLGMLVLTAARLLWLGSALGVFSGVLLLVALAVALKGRPPHVLTVLSAGLKSLANGYSGLLDYGAWATSIGPRSRRWQWLAFMLPLAAVAIFSGIFIMANPALVTSALAQFERLLRYLDQWWTEIPFYAREVVFWVVVGWFCVGLVRQRYRDQEREGQGTTKDPESVVYETSMYVPFRNTLVSVIVLFAVYLVFEFRTLWFREFEEGFYYAGYAHEGAAWLTTALAFSTLALSLIFRGEVLNDVRVGTLRKLAWVWSIENLVLALSVFHRLQIYVNFNGMTRMRTVAYFGTATVVVGFLLVIAKILRNESFSWLIKRQLVALAFAVFVFSLTPVDALVHRYNVGHVVAGDLAPVVQIMHHPINSEGVMMLSPLCDVDDVKIREGIRALLAEHALGLSRLEAERTSLGWKSFQGADAACLRHLDALKDKWQDYKPHAKRHEALAALRDYSYQWY